MVEVNENPAILCASPDWAEHLESDVLAPLVAAVDLGDEMLDSGMMLPLWEDALPNVPDEELAAAAEVVAAKM